MIFDGEISQHNLLWKVEFCGFLLASNIDFGGIIVIYMQRANDVSEYFSPDPRILILTFKQTKSPKALLCTQYSSLQL